MLNMQRYHAWMQSPELLESTASEPLTIEEERDMQSASAQPGPTMTNRGSDRIANDHREVAGRR